MRRVPLAVVITLFAVIAYACGDDDPQNSTTPTTNDAGTGADDDAAKEADVNSSSTLLWKSGTRLRAEVSQGQGQDSPRRFEQFIDTARSNEPCTFRMTSEGMRCLPYGEVVMYDDAACQIPVAITLTKCTQEAITTQYAVRYGKNPDACAFIGTYVEQIFALTGPIAPRAGFQKQGDGSCIPRGVAALDYRGIGAQIPLSAFVGAKITRDDISPAITRGRYVGDDGSELIDGYFYDRGRGGAQCDPNQVGGGPEATRPFVCVSIGQAYASDSTPLFADSTCSAAAQVGTSFRPPSCANKPDVVLRAQQVIDASAPPTCTPSGALSLYAAGVQVAPFFARNAGSGACEAETPDIDERAFAIGAPLDVATLPAFTPATTGATTNRLRLRSLTSESAPIDHGTFWDEQEKTTCYATRFTDGKRYCVSSTSPIRDNTFKDASCQQPIVIASDCEPAPTFVIRQSPTSSCATFESAGWNVGTTKLPTNSDYWRRINETTCMGPLPIGPTFYGLDILTPAEVSTSSSKSPASASEPRASRAAGSRGVALTRRVGVGARAVA